MSTRALYRLLIVFGVALVLLFAYDRVRAIDTRLHSRISEDLRALKELDAQLDQEVLRSRFRIQLHYDPLVRTQAAIASTYERLHHMPAYLPAATRTHLESLLATHETAMEAKIEDIERFKSRNAVLRNSLQYVPVVFAELSTMLDHPGGDARLKQQLDDLVRDVLLYTLSPNPILARSIKDRSERLRRTIPARQAALGETLRSALAHVDALVRYSPEVDGLVREIIAVPTSAYGDRLLLAYASGYAVAVEDSGRARILLYVVSLMLLVCAVYTMMELRRSAREVAEANAHLEDRVRERTDALHHANDQLQHEMEERARVGASLRQAQKLEAVGRLASGVAHEINTPVQFVSDSVHFVRSATSDLTGLIGKYRTANRAVIDGAAASAAAEEAARTEDEVDLEYLLDNVPKALDRSLEGLERVATIVRSMKVFAHPDQKEMVAVDLNQALSSTLIIANNEFKYVADVVTDFGELPSVTCLPGEINQVFLNLIVNAAHAIAGVVQGTEQRGRIHVSTRRDGAWVEVRIEDSGGGIPDEIRERVFDPFFTTKEVGRGTGQGLSIARSVVVDEHGGEIRFESVPGQGTTFVIRLPIEGHKAAVTALAA